MKTLLLLAALLGTAILFSWHLCMRAKSPAKASSLSSLTVATLVHLLGLAWLLVASTYLFWIFPIALILSGVIGYRLGRNGATLNKHEFNALLAAFAGSGAASSVALATQPDKAFGFYPVALLAANNVAFIAAACAGMRRKVWSGCSDDA